MHDGDQDSPPQQQCTGDYDSHDWQWQGNRRLCARCGVEDLDGARLLREIRDKLDPPHCCPGPPS